MMLSSNDGVDFRLILACLRNLFILRLAFHKHSFTHPLGIYTDSEATLTEIIYWLIQPTMYSIFIYWPRLQCKQYIRISLEVFTSIYEKTCHTYCRFKREPAFKDNPIPAK